ncbi:MAG: hypothetical protein N2316_02550 [Spirochaetes bacterium]|nr:hypothetical protein [Spirochaetota bacterium]
MMFLWFRPRLELFWKIAATVIFIFYVWFFYDDLSRGYVAFQAAWFDAIFHFLKELISLVFVNLLLFWPIALVVIFYKADEVAAERLLKFMCILTIVLWIIFILYAYFSRGIDSFLFEKLKKMVPGAQ